MGTIRALSLFLLLTAALVGCSPDGPRIDPENPPPSIVVITIDTLRADRVGANGCPRGLTPNIDTLARESAVFENAVTPIATTGPAHASLFTGLYPRVHGVRWNGDRLRNDIPTLAALLSEAGYDTAAFVSWPNLIKTNRLGRGFSARSENRDTSPDVRSGKAVNRKVERWLGETRRKPFFLWIHYYEVHSPYRLTNHARKHLGKYDGPVANGASSEQFCAYGTEVLPATEEHRAALNALYDGEVVEADLLVGELLAKLESCGLRDDSVIVVTSDHGQVIGEHGTRGHGHKVWEEALRIPLIVHDPRFVERPRIETRVSLLDLFPTLLEYAQLPVPEGIPGRSLMPAIRGEPLGQALYLAETRTGGEWPQLVAAMNGAHKVVVDREGARAYDLEADPGEGTPLPLDRSDVFEKLARIARAVLRTGGSSPTSEGPDKENLEHLRSLGYTK